MFMGNSKAAVNSRIGELAMIHFQAHIWNVRTEHYIPNRA